MKTQITGYVVIVKVEDCARCGLIHENLEAQAFKRPAGSFTHWALCPRTDEPLLVQVRPLTISEEPTPST